MNIYGNKADNKKSSVKQVAFIVISCCLSVRVMSVANILLDIKIKLSTSTLARTLEVLTYSLVLKMDQICTTYAANATISQNKLKEKKEKTVAAKCIKI